MPTRTFTLTLCLLVAAVAALCFFWPRVAHAQSVSAYSQRYAEAAARGDLSAAETALRQALDDHSVSPQSTPHLRAALAVVLVRRGRLEDAAREALVCPADHPACIEATQAVQAAQTTRVSQELPRSVASPQPTTPTPGPPRPPELRVVLEDRRRSWMPRTGPLALWGTGVAAFAAAGVLFALREGSLSGCSMRGQTAVCEDAVALERGRDSVGLTIAADVALGVGAAAVLAGTVWWLLDDHAVVPTVTTSSAMLSFSGRW